MAAYWPTADATANDPIVIERMNNLPKFVVSNTLTHTDWNNSRLIRDSVVENVRELKDQADGDIAIFGSGQLVSSLLAAGIIDEAPPFYAPRHPRAWSAGILRHDRQDRPELYSARPFQSGVIMLTYHPSVRVGSAS